MASPTPPSCTLCCVSLPRARDRRVLHSSATAPVFSILRHMTTELFPEYAVERVFLSDAYLCKQCVHGVEKVMKLRESLNTHEQELRRKITHMGEARGLLQGDRTALGEGGSCSTPTRRTQGGVSIETPTRRPRGEEMRSSRQRRAARDTPTRRTLERMVPGRSPVVSVLVRGKNFSRADIIPRESGLKQMARSVARRNHPALAKQVMRNSKTRATCLKVLEKDIQKDLTKIASKKWGSSCLRQRTLDALESFSWEKLLLELKLKAPTLYHVLQGCVNVRRRERAGRQGKRRVHRPNDSAVLGVCAALLCRHRNQHLNLLQRLISLILHSGHAGKQVYRRLQKMLLCLSHTRTLTTLDELGENHDESVLQWQCNLTDSLMVDETTPPSQLEVDERTPHSHPDQTNESAAGSGSSQTADGSQDSLQTTDGSILYMQDSYWPPERSCDNGELQSSSAESAQQSPSSTENFSTSESSSECCPPSSPEIDIDSFLGPEYHPPNPSLLTYRIVGDNIDKNIKPRNMTSDHQTRSLHYFHAYAVRDRLDLSSYDSDPPVPDMGQMNFESLLPSCNDGEVLHENLAILIGRILRKYMPFFTKYAAGLGRHIMHEHSESMSTKSHVVPLGIILKNETKHDEMVAIMDHLQQYVPTMTTTEVVTAPGHPPVYLPRDHFHQIEFGGDQLTATRARGCQRIRSNSTRGKDRLEGLVPVVEDWHAKVSILGVIWKRLYKCSSGMDCGTLYQLQKLLNRRNVVKEPSKSVAPCEEFFLLVVEAHILEAAMNLFSMNSLDDTPSEEFFPAQSVELDSLQRRRILLDALHKLLQSFVDLSVTFQEDVCSNEHIQVDAVHEYAKEVLSLGLLLLEFNDSVREGDGNRILRCWRYFLPLFKASDRTNYAVEAFTLLAQEKYLLSPRMAMQLKWSRTINVHGRPGKNIPADLHMEHLNRECKQLISGLGANVTDHSIKRVGKCIGRVTSALLQFDTVNNVAGVSGHHTSHSTDVDTGKLLKQLRQSMVFDTKAGRRHHSFPKLTANMVKKVSKEKLLHWMQDRMQKLILYH